MYYLGMLMLKTVSQLTRLKFGLKKKRWHGQGFDITYLQSVPKNGRQTVIFLHGLASSKDQWGPYIYELTKYHNCLFLDMPGEGESSFDNGYNYAPKYQVERLREFIVSNNLEKVVLVGSSIGGCVAAMYADRYPDSVTKLIAIAPAGIKSPSYSKMLTNFIETKEHPFAYKNVDEMMKFWDVVFYKTPKVANFLKTTLAKRGEMRHKKINKIVDDFYQDGIFQLHDKIGNIKTDTMVMWGKNDNIFDVSSASEIQNIRPQSLVKIIDESGHVPYLEKGHQVSNEIDNFIENKIQ